MAQIIAKWRQEQQRWQQRIEKQSISKPEKFSGVLEDWHYERATLSESYLYIYKC